MTNRHPDDDPDLLNTPAGIVDLRTGKIRNHTERLIDILHATCCAKWSRKEISEDRLVRFAQAYLMMADAQYRPAAPGDGMGHVSLTKNELDDQNRLYQEAVEYAVRFYQEDDNCIFNIGCSNYETNRAFVFAIEAARLLAGGSGGDKYAVRLLQLAIKEINDANTR